MGSQVVLQHQGVADNEEVHSGYALLRLFVWALPVLGLIGTVIGIASAVGDFATFLGGKIDEVEVIKTQLVGVTRGLSFAFSITLLGLLGALLLMFAAALLQAREERFYMAVERYVADLFLPSLQRLGRRVEPAATPWDDELWRTALVNAARAVFAELGLLVVSLGASLRSEVEAWGRQLQADAERATVDVTRTFEVTWKERLSDAERLLDRQAVLIAALQAEMVGGAERETRWLATVEALHSAMRDLQEAVHGSVEALAANREAVEQTLHRSLAAAARLEPLLASLAVRDADDPGRRGSAPGCAWRVRLHRRSSARARVSGDNVVCGNLGVIGVSALTLRVGPEDRSVLGTWQDFGFRTRLRLGHEERCPVLRPSAPALRSRSSTGRFSPGGVRSGRRRPGWTDDP
jgi:hypothetical protein